MSTGFHHQITGELEVATAGSADTGGKGKNHGCIFLPHGELWLALFRPFIMPKTGKLHPVAIMGMERAAYSTYRWVVIGALCIVQAMAVAVLVAPATLVGVISESMALTPGQALGVTMVSREIFVILSALAGGVLIDRLGPYWVWAGGSVLLLLGSVLAPVWGDCLYGMLAIRAVHGIGAGPIFATVPLVVAQWVPLGQRGIVMGVQGTFVSLGAAASMVLVPAVLERSGSWQIALGAAGGFPLIALAVSMIVMVGPQPSTSEVDGVNPGRRERKDGDIKRLLALPATWSAACCGLCFGWAVRMIYDIVPSYLATAPPVGPGMEQVYAGRIMSVVHILAIAASISSGFLLERCFGGRPRGLVMIGFIGAAAFLTMVWFPDTIQGHLLISCCLWGGGFAVSLTNPLVLTFVSKCYPEIVMGKISGFVTGFCALGTLSGLVAGSITLHLTGGYHTALLLICVGACCGFVSAFFLKSPVPRLA